jgi:hypothetical protein
MSKNWIFVSGDREEKLTHLLRNRLAHSTLEGRNRLTHDDYTFTIESKDGKLTIVGNLKRPGNSAKHFLPREFLPRGVSDYVVTPDDAAHLIMPEIGQKLLPFILPKKLRAAVAGDLAEDFRTFTTRWGRPYALRWLWWELGGLCIRRFGPTAVISAVGVWFRQKLGW